MDEELVRIFANTLSKISGSQEVLKKFQRFYDELPEQDGDFARWFPRFLKDQAFDGKILDQARFDWIVHQLGQVSQERQPSDRQWHQSLSLNPNLFVEHFQHSTQHLEAGLYALYLTEHAIHWRKLRLEQARILDWLEEGLVLTKESLVSQAQLAGLDKEKICSALQDLTDAGIVLGAKSNSPTLPESAGD